LILSGFYSPTHAVIAELAPVAVGVGDADQAVFLIVG